jgi:hypothetical protein
VALLAALAQNQLARRDPARAIPLLRWYSFLKRGGPTELLGLENAPAGAVPAS